LAIALVNQTSAVWSTGNSIVVTVPAPTNGNALFILLGSANTSPTISSISQTGATWVQAQGSYTNRGADIWYALNVSSAGTTVTVNLSGAGASTISVVYGEFSGIATSAALDAKGANTGNSTAPTTATITPISGKNALILAAMRPGGAISAGPTNSFTSMSVPDTRTRGAYLLVPSTSGTYSTAYTAGSGAWETSIATFLAPAGGSNSNPTASISYPTGDGYDDKYPSGSFITFIGSATDAEDGTLTGTSLAWSSNINGALGTGTTISVNTLSTGSHTITLTATDSQGGTGTASKTITVVDPRTGQFYNRKITYTPINGTIPETHGMQVFVPGNFNTASLNPYVMVLGGSGQRGTDNTTQMGDGPAVKVAASSSTWPVLMVFPQWPASSSYGGREWAYPMITAARTVTEASWSIDMNRRYLTGFSLGAQVAMECLISSSGVWGGVLIAEGSVTNREGLLSGNDPSGSWTNLQAEAEVASNIRTLAIRHFQSTADTNTLPAAAEETRDSFYAGGTCAYYYDESTGPQAGLSHVSAYTAIYNDITQWNWLYSQSRNPAPSTGQSYPSYTTHSLVTRQIFPKRGRYT
jgi:hypothetical protein